MQKRKSNKLQLNRETLKELDPLRLEQVAGGGTSTVGNSGAPTDECGTRVTWTSARC